MKRIAAAFALALALALGFGSGLQAQDADSIVLAYRRNFARASLSTKLELLKEAAARSDASMGPLYDMALRFAVDNSAFLGQDPQLKDLAVLAAVETGEGRLRQGYRRSLGALPGLSGSGRPPRRHRGPGLRRRGRSPRRREPQRLPRLAEQPLPLGLPARVSRPRGMHRRPGRPRRRLLLPRPLLGLRRGLLARPRGQVGQGPRLDQGRLSGLPPPRHREESAPREIGGLRGRHG
jgi:hypothetical protein